MVNYLHPGVFIQEVPSARSIQGVSTSVAAFVGLTEKGPTNVPTLLTSWNAYVRQFGAFAWSSFVSWAVYEFFLEGGTACYVVRSDPGNGKAATTTLGGTQISAASPGTWGNGISVSITNGSSTTGTAPTPVFTLQVVVDASTVNASSASLSDQMMSDFVVQNGLTAVAIPSTGTKTYYVLETFSGFTLANAGFFDRINSNSMFLRVTAVDGARPSNTGSPKPLTGGVAWDNTLPAALNTLKTVQGLSLLAVPDTAGLVKSTGASDTANQAAQINAGLQLCESLQSLFYVIDPPGGMNVQDIVSFKSGTLSSTSPAINSSYGAMYYPWVWITNPLVNLRVPIPASGPVLGRYAHTDGNVGVFKSPAGVNDGAMLSVVSVAQTLSDSDQDQLNPNGIDAVRNLINYGNVIWGARTVSQDTQWTYVSVRRLFIYVEQSLRNSLYWVVFESNDQALWSSVSRDISAFLTTLWQQGGLFGASAAEAFFVICDASNNPAATRSQGYLYIDIGLAPVYPAEFVVIRISQKTAGPDSGN